MTTLAMTKDAKQLLLNPIERISVKIGKIALNPQEATHVGFDDPSQMKILELMQKDEGTEKVDKTMESAVLEQSMTRIIYLLAVSLGYSGAKIIGRNITETGEFDLMKVGIKKRAIFA
jgi:hypothetical protein